MDLQQYRQEIDSIDGQLIGLYIRRMETVAAIAAYKRQHGLPVLDAQREQDKLNAICAAAPPQLREQLCGLYRLLFEQSRAYQQQMWDEAPESEV